MVDSFLNLSSMEESSEEVVGALPVVANLSMGFERLTLYFTDRRLIVGQGGKTGAASVPTTFMLGSIGSYLGNLFGRGKGKSMKKEAEAKYPRPTAILSLHQDNFAISFTDIVSVNLTRKPINTGISILSKDDKFDFTSRIRFDDVLSLFQNSLAAKLHVETKLEDDSRR